MPKSHFHKIFRAFQPSNKESEEPVIVDFVPDNGNMFIIIHNEVDIGMRDITISFNQELKGAKGRVLNGLNIFENLSFLAAGREIEIFAGRVDHFLESLKNERVIVTVTLQLPGKKKFQYSIKHDLSIYTDLPQIINKNEEKL